MKDNNDLSGPHVEASMIKKSFTQRLLTLYTLHFQAPMRKLHSQIGPPSVFCWVSRTRFSLQMASMRSKASPRCRNKKVPIKPGNCTAEYTGTALLKKGIPLTDENLGVNNMLSHLEEDGLKMHDAVPTLYQQSVRCSLAQLGSQSNEPGTNKDHPIEVPPPFIPSNEACFPSSVSGSSDNLTVVMVLLASRAAARACQCPRLLHRKLTEVEGYPQASSYDQSFGLLKAC